MIPITVFTGFLGAGKTTIIIDLIKSLPKDYKVVLLKNEYGDAQGNWFDVVDSALATQSHIQVTEIMNGCLCCVLVGQMKTALLEIKEKQQPDRIIIETSGSAFPAPIAWQIRELGSDFQLDAIITVIDCVNFRGYEDTSYTARMQAQYTDLILLNKTALVNERELDLVVDHVNELNTDTPKLVWKPDGLRQEMVFGIDTTLFDLSSRQDSYWQHLDRDHHDREIDLIQMQDCSCSRQALTTFLDSLSKESVYRVKGIITVDNSPMILNWGFSRYTLDVLDNPPHFRVVVMGVDLRWQLDRFKQFFGQELTFHAAH